MNAKTYVYIELLSSEDVARFVCARASLQAALVHVIEHAHIQVLAEGLGAVARGAFVTELKAEPWEAMQPDELMEKINSFLHESTDRDVELFIGEDTVTVLEPA